MQSGERIVSSDSRAAPRYSMRAGLLALVFVCIAPALVIASIAVHESYALQKQRILGDTIVLARALAASLDREFAGVQAGLQVLASSPELRDGDLKSFHRRASEAIKFQIADSYVVIDRSGQQVANTRVPYGTELPRSAALDLKAVFQTGAPVLSGLFKSPSSGLPEIALGVPVTRRGEVIYVLAIGLSPQRIGDVLAHQALPKGGIAAVLDRTGTIIARSRDGAKFVGKTGVSGLVSAAAEGPEGTLETTTIDGQPVYTAFSRSPASGWTVAAGAPMALLSVGLYRSVAWVLVGAFFAFGVGLWLAFRLARRMTAAVQGLVEPALALGSGEIVAPRPTRLKEAAEVGEALVLASHMLARAQRLAHYDSLTGLCNRVLFGELTMRELALAQRSGTSFAILAIDLDGFKLVNDMHGHAAGDSVLKTVAERILASIEASDVAARLGGDEFAVLLMGAEPERARQTAEALVECLSEPYEGVMSAVSASVGIAVFPQSGVTILQLLERADMALYKAKGSGKRRVASDH